MTGVDDDDMLDAAVDDLVLDGDADADALASCIPIDMLSVNGLVDCDDDTDDGSDDDSDDGADETNIGVFRPDGGQVASTGKQWTAIPIAPEGVFSALSNFRRRIVILSLSRASGTVSAGDLAVEIAAHEEGVEPDDVTGKARSRVYIALMQTHLETLNDSGIVDYDSRSKHVSATPATTPIARVIREVQAACYEPESGGDN